MGPQWYRKCTTNQFADLRVKLLETSKGPGIPLLLYRALENK